MDILFCNAGITMPKLLPDTSDDEIERVFAVNFFALVHAARHAIPKMLAQPNGGSILFTASKTGLVAQTDSPVYCASKGAVVMLAKSLALDYATKGIRVNALCPGIIDTPMLREFASTRPDPAAAWATYEAAQPMGRLGTAKNVRTRHYGCRPTKRRSSRESPSRSMAASPRCDNVVVLSVAKDLLFRECNRSFAALRTTKRQPIINEPVPMKLIRFGSAGAERPGLLLADGRRIDAAGFGSDYDEAFFGGTVSLVSPRGPRVTVTALPP